MVETFFLSGLFKPLMAGTCHHCFQGMWL